MKAVKSNCRATIILGFPFFRGGFRLVLFKNILHGLFEHGPHWFIQIDGEMFEGPYDRLFNSHGEDLLHTIFITLNFLGKQEKKLDGQICNLVIL